MNTRAVSRAKMQRAIKALTEAGLPFAGLRIHPDGAVDVLVGSPLTGPANDPQPIDPLDQELAGWDAKHGYG